MPEWRKHVVTQIQPTGMGNSSHTCECTARTAFNDYDDGGFL